ncbi:MAG: 4Fe-4S binding protein [Candidatus Omnitrophota bacterium]|nr:4Fe-4S binding protein [Candidatus Omnitrophota bacterium]
MVILRRVSQVFFLCAFMYVLWSTTYPLTGSIPSDVFFVSDPHIVLLTAVAERMILPGTAVVLAMLFFTFIFGRFFCGWICPLGAAMDISSFFNKRKVLLKEKVNARIRKIKYFVLGISSIAAVLGVQIAWATDPVVMTARFISLSFIPAATLFLDRSFMFLVRDVGFYGKVYDIYRTLKSSVLGINAYFFGNTGMIVIFFAGIVLSAFFVSRLWCRTFCPLGAMYGLISKHSLLVRKASGCVSCGKCMTACRMESIKNPGDSYTKSECVLCMDCVYACPGEYTKFTFRDPFRSSVNNNPTNPTNSINSTNPKGLSRKDFILLLISSLFLSAFRWRKRNGSRASVTRPPGALRETEFVARCVRCGNCMKVCPTNVVQPAVLEAGLEGIWTPKMMFEIGYCEYNCTLCGQVCPTGALKKMPLKEKQKTPLGKAVVRKDRCLPWSRNENCLVCEEHCPVPDKAIKIDIINSGGIMIQRPVVDRELCIGCGICQNKCPVRPSRAIEVIT